MAEKFHKYNKLIRVSLYILVIALAVFMIFFRLGDSKLQTWDEQLYSDCVKETLSSGNPFLMKYQGTYFFEKPPLWVYVTEIPASIFGVNNTTVRSVNAVSALVILVLVFLIIKRKTKNEFAGMLGVLALLAVQQNFVMNPAGWFGTHNFRSADLDYFQIMFFVLAFYLIPFVNKNKKYMYLIAFVLGLAIMAKGFVTLLPAGIIYLYFLVKRKQLNINIKNFAISILIFLLTFLPWHLWMITVYGKDFIDMYFFKNIVYRSTKVIEGHNYPFYFYIKNFLDPRFDAMGIIFTSVITYFLFKLKNKKFDFDYIYPIAMIVGTIGFFTLVVTKISWYILPIFPFFAIMTGYFFDKIKSHKRVYLIFLIIFLVLFLLGISDSIRLIILQSRNLNLG